MQKCEVKTKNVVNDRALWLEAEYLGVFQRSVVKQAILIGEVGGTISMPVAVVKLDGKLLELNLEQVRFKED